MKAYEMMAMLEKNPKLRFKKSTWSDGNLIGIEDGKIKMLFGSGEEWNKHEPGNKYYYACEFLVKGWSDWELVRKPVPSWRAIKALSEGEIVKVVTPDKHEYILDPQDNECISTYTLLNGTWFIEEGDSD